MNATLSLKNKVVTLLNRDIPPRRKKRIVGVEEQGIFLELSMILWAEQGCVEKYLSIYSILVRFELV